MNPVAGGGRTVLVTGGNGFIGSHVVETLRATGSRVRVLSRSSPRTDMDWTGVDYHDNAHTDKGVLDAVRGCDAVVHLAGTTVPSTSNADPAADVDQNLIESLRLMKAMKAAGVRRIVFYSSGGTVYGVPRALPIHETHPLQPTCSYGIVKLAIERYLLMEQAFGTLDPLILRPSNPFGPRQRDDGRQGVIAWFFKQLQLGEPLTIWGDGSMVRDYIYVRDLAGFTARAVWLNASGVYNLGSGRGTSLQELVQLIAEVTGVSPDVNRVPSPAWAVSRVELDSRAAESELGWNPRTPLRDGLAATWAALRGGA